MKALIYGQENIDKTLSIMLKNEGIEMQTLVDDFDTTNLCLEEKYDLAIVDSRSNNANKACRYIRENRGGMPLILIVNSLEVNWKRLKPIEADGYISDANKGKELSARSQALLRRLLRKKVSGQ